MAHSVGVPNAYGTYISPWDVSSQGQLSAYISEDEWSGEGRKVGVTINNGGIGGAFLGDRASDTLALSLLDACFPLGIACGGLPSSPPSSCDTSIAFLSYLQRNYGSIPVQLGMPFQLSYEARVSTIGGGVSGESYYGYSSINQSFNLAFFDLDGTPVQVESSTPELGGMATIGIGVVCLLGTLQRHRARQ